MDLQDETEFEQDLLNHLDKAEYDYFSGTVEETDEKDAPKNEHLEVLSRCFGHKKFRPMQWKIINSLITDRRDNCAIMTTGYGKSLCYQYPSVFTGGTTIVISPLISLMEDQVLAMKVANIAACLLGTANMKQRETIKDILKQKYNLVYLTPEFCTGDNGKELLEKMCSQLSISLIAIDEAHCVSSWGHDFRYQYRQLGILKSMMPDVPILAVTATATPQVRDDIIKILKLRDPQILCSGFDRPNLYFSVYLKSGGVLQDLRKVMERRLGEWKFIGSTIIYCITRRETEDISTILSETGIKCLPYHAGLSLSLRKETHEKFVRDKIDVVTATIAFGMGIDKPDVRNVIHYGASNSLEGYYQEVGRAGRDGLPAKCIAFYANRDFDIHRRLRENSSAANQATKAKMADLMRDFLDTRDCRREFILSHFEGKAFKPVQRGVCCDNCTRNFVSSDNETFEGVNSEGKYDFTEDAKIFLEAVRAMDGMFGLQMYILFLRGSRSSKIARYMKNSLYGSGKHKAENWWKGIGGLLEREGYLEKVYHKHSSKFSYFTVSLSQKCDVFLRGVDSGTKKLMATPTPELFACLQTKRNAWLGTGMVNSRQMQPSTSSAVEKLAIKDKENDPGKESTMKLYRILLNKRYELATAQECMPYLIASNKALMDMAEHKPITLKQMRDCQLEGFTEVKISKFGEEFLMIVRGALGANPEETSAKMSIQDALIMCPLGGTKIGTTVQATYSLFKTGLSIPEIAAKRALVEPTILSHLVDCMKLGYPIKMAELGVTSEIKATVIRAIEQVETGMSLLTPIKNACPPEITFNQVKVVVAYVQIRNHLKKIGCPYEDFENDQSVTVLSKVENNSTVSGNDDLDSQQSDNSELTQLINAINECEKSVDKLSDKGEDSNFSEGFADADLAAACDQLETSLKEESGEDFDETIVDDCEPPIPKRSKTEYSFGSVISVLDSPPRESQVNHETNAGSSDVSSKSQNIKIKEVDIKVQSEPSSSSSSKTSKKNNASLPPWLVKKRIA